MPYAIRKQRCKDSQRNSGSYVIYYKDTNAKVSCHASYEGATSAMKALYSSENKDAPDISDEDVRILREDRMKMELGCCRFEKYDKMDRIIDQLLERK